MLGHIATFVSSNATVDDYSKSQIVVGTEVDISLD
jgi:hypothetical protein